VRKERPINNEMNTNLGHVENVTAENTESFDEGAFVEDQFQISNRNAPKVCSRKATLSAYSIVREPQRGRRRLNGSNEGPKENSKRPNLILLN
jgi:hypothetical protein